MLSITVYCNCIEAGKLLVQPKPNWKVTVWGDEDGMVEVETSSQHPEDIAAMHQWWESACPHPDRKAFSDADFVSLPQAIGMREEISRQGEFPVLIGNVFESGVHEHWLGPEQLPVLKEELARLDRTRLSDWAQKVINKLSLAADVANEVQKPISF